MHPSDKLTDLINQGYSPFLYDQIPHAHTMDYVASKNHILFWCEKQKRYLVFDRTRIVGGLKIYLKTVVLNNWIPR